MSEKHLRILVQHRWNVCVCVSISIGKDIVKPVPVYGYNIHMGDVDLKH